MKITDPDIIKTGEKDLIDAVKDDLDLDAVKQVLEKKLAATVLSAKGGEIIVHDNKIAFRLDFDLNLSGSLMFDREGNYISAPDDLSENPTDDSIEAIGVDTPEPDEVNLDEIDIHETLEELKPDAPNDDAEENIQEDDQEEIQDGTNELNGDESNQIESEIIDDIDIEEDLDINLLDDDLDDELVLEDEPSDFEPLSEETELLEDEPDLEYDLDDEDAISDDEDIDDILKESRDFWDQKKDS